MIVGQDTSFTFAKLAYASLAIQQGAKFVATNPDAADAVGPGLMPGAGAIVAAVEKATGVSPEIYAGKPSAFLLELLKGNYVDMSRTLVVGDRLDTDIAFGKAGGAGMTVLALGGVCTVEDVEAALEAGEVNVPDHIVEGLPQMLGLEPEDAAMLEFVEDADDEQKESLEMMGEDDDLDEFLEEEGFEDDEKAREAFGAY